MTDPSEILGLSSTSPDAFDPMVIDGENHGLVHWVRNDIRKGHEYRAAIWVMPAEQLPYESPYLFQNDETFTVIEGELEITWADETVTVLRPGDVISVAGGTMSSWRITTPFKKFVVEVQL